ncbi:MAG: glycosyltransferase [Planctomycetota bacterium]
MDVSVIIPHYNDADRLRECLACLAEQVWPGFDAALAVEVIVVDNGSTDLSAAEAAVGEHSGLATLMEESKPGSYAARNAALKRASGRYVAFTDSDCRPDPAWLAEGIKALEAEPKAGMVGGRIEVFPQDERRPKAVELYELVTAFDQKGYLDRRQFAATANVVTRRETLDQVGDFDESLKSGGDANWGRRVAEAGLVQRYAPEAVVRHPARRDFGQILGKKLRVVGSGPRFSGQTLVKKTSPLQVLWNNTLGIPVGAWRVAMDDRLSGLGARAKVFGVHLVIRGVSVFERIRLVAGGVGRR